MLTNEVFWQDLTSTLIITVVSVAIELVLGFALAYVMHRAIFAKGLVRASLLVPYGIITVVAAFAWRFAFDPTTGFVNGLLNTDRSWFSESWSSYLVIIATEVWKTTPFMSLLLLAGFTLVPDDVVQRGAGRRRHRLAAADQDHHPADEAGDPRRPPVPHARRLPHLRLGVRADPGRAGHRDPVDPRLQHADHPAEPRARLGASR